MKLFNKLICVICIFILFSCELFLGSDAKTDDASVLYSLYDSFAKEHAYIEIKMDFNPYFDTWEEAYLHYNDLLVTGRMSLFQACAGMLDELKDPHIALYDNKGNVSTMNESYFSYRRNNTGDLSGLINGTRRMLNNNGTIVGNYNLIYGTFIEAPDIGYLYILDFSDTFTWTNEIDSIVDFLKRNTRAVIIDIRYNAGGLIPVMEYIASRFSVIQTNYAMASTKNGPGFNDFSPPIVFKINPVRTAYTKPVVLLTNKASISAAEWFTLALRTQPHVTHVGTNTCGAFSMRTIHPMINGWFYSISAYKVTDMKGFCYEGFGIKPEVIIPGDEDDIWIENPETQLLKVLKDIDNFIKGN